jgi:isoleucyl-tRNA synthetase
VTFSPAPAQLDLPALERRVLAQWEEADVFGRTLAATKDGPVWAFYDGPPTANGKPGIHHAEPRVFKDVFCRFRAMTGHHVPRRAGWDCHGLPVELAVEKELGFSGKQEIERYGIAAFNEKCRESVLRHVGEHQELSRRMGYWVDQVNAYRTMDPDYIDAVWWSLKTIFDKGLLVEDHRVAPYCPRCGTALSDHEVAQGYAMVSDPSVYVRFPLVEDDRTLLVWTTTPWTLVSNTAVAVHPDVTYVTARVGDERLIVAEPLVEKALGPDAEIEERFPGRDLERRRYVRPFDLIEIPDAHYVTLATYVTTEDGTGLVHTAPAFGAEDLEVARAYGLPVVNPITAKGEFEPDVPVVGGRFFKDVDADLTADLTARGLLWRGERYEHSYPHCWRCDTPLINYATPSWYIRTTAIKDRLLAENAKTDWHPETIRDGRYGDWLENNIDWSLSRSRYWGTPLPIWRCDEGHLTVVGSRTELGAMSGTDCRDLDPHRPFVDEVMLPCRTCGATAQRVPEVIDCWYDAGSMPFAQWGAPHRNVEAFERQYPAKFICEAIDQTRGWFYTLMAIGTLVFDRSSYETVLCLGHIVDAEGRKMSKHLGNILEPFELFERHGADPVRWLLLCVGTPWSSRRVGDAAIEEVVRKVLLTYWNTVSFFTLYASTGGWSPGATTGEKTLMDRWLLSELHATVAEVTASLEAFDTTRAGRRLTQFVDDLSNWYVRRCRRRFWKADPAALETLHETLLTLTKVLAPFVPFLTEEVWSCLHGEGDSVHLATWPAADAALVDERLSRDMATVRRLVELGRATRAKHGVKTRQPLPRALVSPEAYAVGPELLRELAEELNVVTVLPLDDAAGVRSVAVKANFRSLGRRFGKDTAQVAAAIDGGDQPAIARQARDGAATLAVPGLGEVTLTLDDVVITEAPAEGWAVESEGGATLALDLTITPELRRAGLARDAVRAIQESRKANGLDVSDRIELWWQAEGEVGDALAEHGGQVADEVLAVRFDRGHPPIDMAHHDDPDLGLTWWLRAAGQ